MRLDNSTTETAHILRGLVSRIFSKAFKTNKKKIVKVQNVLNEEVYSLTWVLANVFIIAYFVFCRQYEVCALYITIYFIRPVIWHYRWICWPLSQKWKIYVLPLASCLVGCLHACLRDSLDISSQRETPVTHYILFSTSP